MSNQNPPSSKDTPPSAHRIPQSVVQACRDEIDDELLRVEVWELKIKDGKLFPIQPESWVNSKLPADLHGDCFFVAALPPRPVANDQAQLLNSQGCQRTVEAQGNLIINGDGMIYRLTLRRGTVKIKTRIAKTPCYYADIITEQDPETYPSKTYAFRNNGPSRISAMLGSRNQLNTAFLKTPDHRLLLTFDAGRPWEIDPETMELLAPVGMKQEWLSLFPFLENSVFPVLSSPAHPVLGLSSYLGCSTQDEIFTLNYSIGYKGKFRKQFDRLIGWNRLYHYCRRQIDQDTDVTWRKRYIGFTDLIRYDFNASQPTLERWQLVLKDKDTQQRVVGEQSLHQLAITEHYIIFGDIAFRIEYSELLFSFIFGLPERLLNRVSKQVNQKVNQIFSKIQKFGRETFCNQWSLNILNRLEAFRLQVGYWLYQVFRKLLPPSQYTNFYIIERDKIDGHLGHSLEGAIINIPVKQVTIPREVSHFAADYDDRHNQIILHVGHNNGWDVTEWVSQYDKSVKGKESQFGSTGQLHRLGGMIVGTTDLHAFGRYTIDAEKGEIIDAKVLLDAGLTWGISVYTHRELDCSHQAITNLYWLCTGFSWELIPERIFEIYKSSPLRVIPHKKLPDKDGKPTTLIRLDTQQMKIMDWFQFPSGYYVCSPQFIPSSAPCPPGKDPSIHGYIACVVLSDSSQGDEFWIFDASNLGNCQDLEDDSTSQPVVYRLSSPHKLNLGFSIHSTWCSEYVRNIGSIRYGDRQHRRQIRRNAFKSDYRGLQYHKNKKENEKIRKLLCVVQDDFVEQTLEKELE